MDFVTRGDHRYLCVPAIVLLSGVVGCSSLAPGLAKRRERNEPQIETQMATSRWDDVEPSAQMAVDFASLYITAKNYTSAKEHLDRAFKLDSKFVPAYVVLGKLHLAQDEPMKAIKALEDGLALNPELPALWNEMAIAHMKQNNYPKAIDAMERALKSDPSNELYITNLAGMLAVSGQFERSYMTYLKVVPSAEARYRVAGVMNAKGDADGSKLQLQLALQDDPKHSRSTDMLRHLSDSSIHAVGYTVPATGYDPNVQTAAFPPQ